MTEKDIEKIYDDLEKYLIRNIKRNLTSDLDSFHLNEEKQLGFKWEAWQSAKLRELKRYRRQNKSIINKRLKNINSKIAEVLRNESRQGKLDAFKNFKAALTHGYKSSIKVKDSFFKINDRKVNTLIKSVNNDFSDANRAVLRRSNDVYRQIIAEASMYNQTGVMTERQAIKKAIDDFSARGIDCIVYSNGARHTISNYSKMAIRTASTRAHLQGEGLLRQKIKQPLILMSKHNTACKLCQPFEGKVLIDDIYSGGTKKDGNYTLLSDAMKQGLYHPNCKHGHGTYYKELGKNVSNQIIETLEQPKELYDTNLFTKQRKDGDFELSGNIKDMYLTDAAREKVNKLNIKTTADFEKYLKSKGIELKVESKTLRERMNEEIPAVKQQIDYNIVAIEQYSEIGGLSKLKTIHFFDPDLEVGGQYVYTAIGEKTPYDDGHIYLRNNMSGFEVMHEYAHVWADSTKPIGEDAVTWSAKLNRLAELKEESSAYFGANKEVYEAERFADTISRAFCYGKKDDIKFLVNVCNILKK